MRFSEDDLASYSEDEVLAPGETQPFQVGRTDQKGRILFAPDRPGSWTVRVQADSQHGLHGINVKVEVGPDMVVQSYTRPLVARHTRLLVGIGLLLGVLGSLALMRRRSGNQSVPLE